MSRSRIPIVSDVVGGAGDIIKGDFSHGFGNTIGNILTGGVLGDTKGLLGDYGQRAQRGTIDAGLLAASILGGGALSGAFSGAGAAGAGAADTAAAAGTTSGLADFAGSSAGGALSDSAIAGGATTGATSALDAGAPTAATTGATTAAGTSPSFFQSALAKLGLGPSTTGAQPLTMADVAASNSGGGVISDSAITGGATSGATPSLSALDTTAGGDPSMLDRFLAFTKAHPIATTFGGLAGSQLLSPLLQNITGSGLTSQEKALLANAQPAINAANQLVGSEASGVLPPGQEAGVDQALQSDIANIKARYASMGMSGSSAEQQDIANAQQSAVAQRAQLAQQATTTGLNALQLTDSVYQTLVTDQLNRQQELSNAFANFFSSVGEGAAVSGALKAA